MAVFPVRRIASAESTMPRRSLPPAAGPSDPLGSTRPNPLDWARRRRADREARRVEAAGARALSRLEHLGPAWHVVDWPRTDLPDSYPAELRHGAHRERPGFLAIGPSGLFAVTIADHGRSRVMIAGDVVQINGKRPNYVAQARREAKRASAALSAAVGLTIPVAPVLTFVGTGDISVYGLPKGCLVATHRELDRLLVAGGNRISPATAEKLARVAETPSTWMSAAERAAANYRWYNEGRTAADKTATRR